MDGQVADIVRGENKMIMYDFQCEKCGHIFESLVDSAKVTHTDCTKCNHLSKKIMPNKITFNLKYNPQKDICDWSGNTTRYWDDYKKMKAEGKNPRIPALDGDGK